MQSFGALVHWHPHLHVPVAEGRLRDDADRAEVELVSDARDGPYVGVHRRRLWLGKRHDRRGLVRPSGTAHRSPEETY